MVRGRPCRGAGKALEGPDPKMTENETQSSYMVFVGMSVDHVVRGSYLSCEKERGDDGLPRIEPGAVETAAVDEDAYSRGAS